MGRDVNTSKGECEPKNGFRLLCQSARKKITAFKQVSSIHQLVA